MRVEHIKQDPQTPLTAKQVSSLLRVAEVGSKWVIGKLSLDDVQGILGELSVFRIRTSTTYFYKEDGLIGASFKVDTENERTASGMGRRFEAGPESWKSATIPRDVIEKRLGLHRAQPGELIDGVRKEWLVYAMRPILPMQDPDVARFNLRIPLSDDSPFDVRVTLQYRANPDEPGQSTRETTTYFESIEIVRWYLTPEELEQRDHAKRVKYGYMNLRSGMICPETGYWQAWTETGPVDTPFKWWEGRKFDVVYLPPPGMFKAVNGRFTWVRSDW